MIKFRKFAVVAVFVALGATQAAALSVPSSCDGQVFQQTFRGKGDSLDLRQSDPNDIYTITVHNPGTFTSLSSRGICSSASDCNGKTFSFGPSQDRILISGFGDGVDSRITVTCSNGPGDAEIKAGRDATGAAGGASGGNIGGAIGFAMGARNGGGAPVISSSGLFLSTLSTQGPALALDKPRAALWASVQGTQFDGSLDGDGVEFTLGGDFEIAEGTYLGAVLSYGDYEIISGAITYETTALSFGPYLSARISERYSLDAYVVMAEPEYFVAGTTYRTDRVSAGVKASAKYDLWGYATTSSLGVSGFSEDLPAAAIGGARTVSSLVGSLATRIEFAPEAQTRPYISIGVDSIRFKDGATVFNSVSPRLGLGVDMNGPYGNLNLRLDAGEVFDTARAVTFGFTWKLDI